MKSVGPLRKVKLRGREKLWWLFTFMARNTAKTETSIASDRQPVMLPCGDLTLESQRQHGRRTGLKHICRKLTNPLKGSGVRQAEPDMRFPTLVALPASA